MDKVYGEWTVLSSSPDKKYYSRCQCSCGAIRDVANSTLRLGKSKSCGHDIIKAHKEKRYKESDKKIIGNRFGRLVALERVNDTGVSEYLCKCDCGGKVVADVSQLSRGKIMSCGCLRKETSTQSMDKIMATGHERLKEGQVEGTSIYTLEQKISKNNRTGIKGVSKMSNGKYRAYINLNRKQRYLGLFNTIEEAQEARLQAEKDLYEPILKKFNREESGE